jgi:hypothetical protein
VVDVSPKARKKELLGTLNEVASLSGSERNMIAHDAFMADDEGDGVVFLTVKAKDKLSVPKIRWSMQEFFEK